MRQKSDLFSYYLATHYIIKESSSNKLYFGFGYGKMQEDLILNPILGDLYANGGSLEKSDLKGANLRITVINSDTLFYEGTTLPDGTKWTPDTDMARFTDPEHKEFWEPEWVKERDESAGG